MGRCCAILAILFLSAAASLSAQDAVQDKEPLPMGFENLLLGMSLEDVKDQLLKSDSFYYRGDPDVSLLDRENRTLLEVEGLGFFSSAQFQFSPDDRLYVIALVLDRERIDFFSLYTTLSGKYGQPVDFSPKRAFWENNSMRLVLERPLTVRYIYSEVFDDLAQEGEALKSYERISREEFLSRF